MAWRCTQGVWLPSLYLSIYRGREEGVAPLEFPLGGRRPGQMGSPLWVTWPPSQEVGTLDGAPQTPWSRGNR